MTHASPEELHDHAHGFRRSEHVDACDACRRAGETLAAERGALREALAEPPAEAPPDLVARIGASRARRRISPAAFAAAAVLLGALAWLLVQPHRSRVERPVAAPALVPQEEEIDRLVAQLHGPTALHQELAALALKAYGASAIPKLEQVGADPRLIEACRGRTREDLEVLDKLRSVKVTIEMTDAALLQLVDYLREISGLTFTVVNVETPDLVKVNWQARDVTLFEALDQLKAQTRIPWAVQSGRVFLGYDLPAPVSRAPVRLPGLSAWAASLPATPTAALPRESLKAAMSKLARAAEPSLWSFLDSPDADIRAHAEAALRRLYGGSSPNAPPTGVAAILEKKILSLSFENAQLFEILAYLAREGGISIAMNPRSGLSDKTTTFKVKDLSLKNALKLLLSQFTLDFVILGDLVVLTPPDLVSRTGPAADATWTSPETAAQVEGLLQDLLSGDAARAEQARRRFHGMGREALPWLRHAADLLDGDASERCAHVRRDIADAQGIWLVDERPGAEAQTLAAAQSAVLDRPVTVDSLDRTLETILREQGVTAIFKATISAPLPVSAHGLKLKSLLHAGTAPLGMDFYLDGTTIVVDTASNVRAAVGLK